MNKTLASDVIRAVTKKRTHNPGYACSVVANSATDGSACLERR